MVAQLRVNRNNKAIDIEDLKNRIDITDLIQSQRIELKKSGKNFKGKCPFHNEKTPSFTVEPEQQFFKCFGCGESGDAIAFYAKFHNLSNGEAIRELARSYGLDTTPGRILKAVSNRKKTKPIEVKLTRLESPAADCPEPYIVSDVPGRIKNDLESSEIEEIVYHYSRTQRVYRYQNPDNGRKTFRQWSHSPDGKSWGKGDQPWLAYRLKEASEALERGGNALLVQEGEKCVELARSIGLASITFQGSCWDEKDIKRSLGGLLVACPDLTLVVLADTGDAGEKKGKILKATAQSMGLKVAVIGADQLVADLENNSDIEQILARLTPGEFIEQLEKLAGEISGGGNEPPLGGVGNGGGGDDDNFDEAVALAQKLEEARAVIGDRIKFNELTQYYELDGEVLKFDDLRLTLATTFNLDLKIGKASIGIEDLRSIVRAIGDEHKFHPIRTYLTDCHQKHSDKSILDTFSDRYFGTNNPLYNTFLRKFLIGCVARVFDPGCKLDTSLILQSPQQGLFKSTFFEELAGQDWYCNDMGGLGQKDEVLKLHMNWLVEWAELETIFTRKDNSQVKSFLSTRQDLIRPPYGRTTERRARHSVICGTTNQSEFLSDPTGHRRFWVIPVSKHIPIALLKQERDLIWGAATACYLAGEPWWLTAVEDEESAANNKFFEIGSAWEDELKRILKGKNRISTCELLQELGVSLQDSQLVKRTESALKYSMARIGWNPCRFYVGADRIRGYEILINGTAPPRPSHGLSHAETLTQSEITENGTARTALSNEDTENQNEKIDQSFAEEVSGKAVLAVPKPENSDAVSIPERDGPPSEGCPGRPISFDNLSMGDILFDRKGKPYQLTKRNRQLWETHRKNEYISRQRLKDGEFHLATVEDIAGLVRQLIALKDIKQFDWLSKIYGGHGDSLMAQAILKYGLEEVFEVYD